MTSSSTTQRLRCGIGRVHIPHRNYSFAMFKVHELLRKNGAANGYSYGVRSLLVGKNDSGRKMFAGTLDRIRRSVLTLLQPVAFYSASNSCQQGRRSSCGGDLSDQCLKELSRVRAGRRISQLARSSSY